MIKAQSHPLRISGLFAVLMAILLGLALAGPTPATAAASLPNDKPQVVKWTDSAGRENTARALPAAEIKTRGLDKYVDMSRLAVTTPKTPSAGTHGTAATDRVTAAKRPAGTVSQQASGCWASTFGYGVFSGLELWGKTDVTWCTNDGTWVSYATSACYGYSNFPTYAYQGCANYPNYGAGWNLYQVKTQWTLCNAYVPIWGSCTYADYPWQEYQFNGNGSITRIGGS